ncbi:hypothetical protein EXIGLDRAFT_775017 [Exidia glandulosa HHB12029]|uniref:F-box domain-containing protein n=1 Tax=Exidia glandulosa HHB12029 TaxID=1314781 RepID=A0A165E3J8_EXIGL|nr:hypothetical protein EXIGLDRAFT_775017 [Exidia glandulosa HHB12029]
MVLNMDILCEIFDFVAFSDTAAGARLSRVSKWVTRLPVPRIFKFLVLDNYRLARLYNAYEHTPPPFALHVEINAPIAAGTTTYVMNPCSVYLIYRIFRREVCNWCRAYDIGQAYKIASNHCPQAACFC